MLQSNDHTIWWPDKRPDCIVTLALALRLRKAPTKENLLALHKQIYQLKLRDTAHEAFLEASQAVYWRVTLSAHLSVLQSLSEPEAEAQDSSV